MSLKRSKLWITVVLAALSCMSRARAEHPTMPATGPTVQLERFTPFIEPDSFGPDFQFFAPADVSSYGGGDPANTGFYVTYDRLYINMQRPKMRPILRVGNEPFGFGDDLNPDLEHNQGLLGFTGDRETGYDGDFGWGNRYDFGFMTEDDHGWNAVVWHLTGPAQAVSVFQERLNRINEDDEPPTDPDPIIADRNPREYHLKASINDATFSSVEINKVWRRKEFHNGGVLEPFMGLRYMQFKDKYRQDGYGRYDIGPDLFPDLSNPNPLGLSEVLVVDRAHFENNMFGGHLGFRYFYEKAHWNLSTEVRMFACHNFQYLTRYQATEVTTYDLTITDPVYILSNRATAYDRSDEFVWGGELRTEASYALTRDISFRFGAALINLAQGVGRGNDIRDNTEDVMMAGVTFGLTVNR